MTATLPDLNTLLEAGVHHGHLSKHWSPDFRPYLLMKQNKRHIINLRETLRCLENAGQKMKEIAAAGQKILFIGRKKQAKDVMKQAALELNQPYVTEKRWLGGALTNFAIIKKRLHLLLSTEHKHEDPTYIHLTKKEKLIADRKTQKLALLLQGMTILKRLPAAIFIVDVRKEATAVKEASKLGIPIIALIDSNSPASLITYPIPANDDTSQSIQAIVTHLAQKIQEGNTLWEKEKQQRKTQLPNNATLVTTASATVPPSTPATKATKHKLQPKLASVKTIPSIPDEAPQTATPSSTTATPTTPPSASKTTKTNTTKATKTPTKPRNTASSQPS